MPQWLDAISRAREPRWVLAAAGAEGVSGSAWLTAAARRALLVREELLAVKEWEAGQGALSDAGLAAARRRVAKELPVHTRGRWT